MKSSVHILRHAHIYTGDATRPWVSALAILNGRVIALDQEAIELGEAAGAIHEELEGALVIPGLTDAHIHLMWCAQGLREIDLRGSSREDMVARVAERAKQIPPGTWITGRGWDQNTWVDSSFPSASDLDCVAPSHPVVLHAKSEHALVANTRALQIAEITAQTPDPPHGKIVRDEHGEPTGLFLEGAMDLVDRAIPSPDFDVLIDLIDEAQGHLLAQGITGVHDMDGAPAFEAEQELRRQGRQHIRIVKYVRQESLDALLQFGLRSGFGDDWLRFGGLKLFADGALGARTAAMFTPYQGEPENLGLLTMAPAQLQDIARRAATGGIALAIHAIGDRANHLVLDTLESVRSLDPTLRHRIEHVQLIRPEDQIRLAHGGFVASMQPVHAIHDMKMADRYWGDRCVDAYAWRSLRNAGAVLAFGSDAPVELFNPFLGLYAAVTRRPEESRPAEHIGWYQEQCLTMAEALHAYTIGAAYAGGLEDRLGRLMPGYYADLVVLNHNIFELPPEALLETVVMRAMVEGEWQDLL